MIHPNPFISAFIRVPEWAWKNRLRRWLAFSPLVPDFIQDFSPIKGYELFRMLQPGDVVVDAGAFPGDYALYAADKVGPLGRVIAFEPTASNRRILERNIRKSGVQNITVIPKGLWNEATSLTLDAHGPASTVQAGEGAETVVVTTLDAALETLGVDHIDVLKMDIEGAELQALEGAKTTLETSRPHTCVASYHLVDGRPTAGRVEQRLMDAGLVSQTAYKKHLTTYGWSDADLA